MTNIIAHRGASFDAPENTLSSFRLAWEQGADGIEGDFMLTSDGKIAGFDHLDGQRLAGDPARRERLDARQIASARRRPLEGPSAGAVTVPHAPRRARNRAGGKKVVFELKDGPAIVEPFARDLARLP